MPYKLAYMLYEFVVVLPPQQQLQEKEAAGAATAAGGAAEVKADTDAEAVEGEARNGADAPTPAPPQHPKQRAREVQEGGTGEIEVTEPGGQDDQGATVECIKQRYPFLFNATVDDVSVTANNGSGGDGAAAVAEAGAGGGGGGSGELHMSFTVRFSVAHRKHEAMESAGLFKGAWPSVAFPPHRSVSSWLRERVLGYAVCCRLCAMPVSFTAVFSRSDI